LAHCSHETYHFAPCTEAPGTLWPALHVHNKLHRKIQTYKTKLLCTWAQLSIVTAKLGHENKSSFANEKQNENITIARLIVTLSGVRFITACRSSHIVIICNLIAVLLACVKVVLLFKIKVFCDSFTVRVAQG
jgi:hypothetical protein